MIEFWEECHKLNRSSSGRLNPRYRGWILCHFYFYLDMLLTTDHEELDRVLHGQIFFENTNIANNLKQLYMVSIECWCKQLFMWEFFGSNLNDNWISSTHSEVSVLTSFIFTRRWRRGGAGHEWHRTSCIINTTHVDNGNAIFSFVYINTHVWIVCV